MGYSVKALDSSNEAMMLRFLKEHEDYCMFLLGNFVNFGGKITESPYSGNFYCLQIYDEVVAVFSLARNGSLLIHSVVDEPVFEPVLKACQQESNPIKAVMGNWEFCDKFWEYLKDKKLIKHEVKVAKEILYSIELNKIDFEAQANVRNLNLSDFSQWKILSHDYIEGEGFPNPMNDDQLFKSFQNKVIRKVIWGLFIEDKLVTMGELNAMAFDVGQVGSVYTDPHYRKKGYCTSLMKQILLDAKNIHNLRKLVIFTGEDHTPARKVYEALGVKQVGYYALKFGE